MLQTAGIDAPPVDERAIRALGIMQEMAMALIRHIGMHARGVRVHQDEVILVEAADIDLLLANRKIRILVHAIDGRQRRKLVRARQIQRPAHVERRALEHDRMRRRVVRRFLLGCRVLKARLHLEHALAAALLLHFKCKLAVHEAVLGNDLPLDGGMELVEHALAAEAFIILGAEFERIHVRDDMALRGLLPPPHELARQRLAELDRLEMARKTSVEESLDMIFEERFPFCHAHKSISQ